MPSRSSPDPSEPANTPPSGEAVSRGKYAGRRLGKFHIVGELGRGGMGVVLEALDTVLQRHVAIKMLPRALAAQPDALQRFLREARAVAKLQHPHVVAVHDADQFNGQYYIVLELVRGGNLQDALESGPFGWFEATRVLVDACRGLEVAHRAGLVHRDIKPGNLMRAEDGTVKLSDFGLARPVVSTGATMTASGSVLGTPQFMSPEQCRSELADERSDIYSMGATYYALLTGRVPYPGEAPLLVMNAHLWNKIPDPRDVDPTIPPSCAAIVQRAMAKDPEDRYSSALALLADLEAVLATSAGENLATDRRPGVTRQGVDPAATRRREPTPSGTNRGRPWTPRWPGTRSVVLATLLTGLLTGLAVALWLVSGWIWSWATTRSVRPDNSTAAFSDSPTAAPAAPATPGAALPIATLPDEAFRLPGMRPDPAGPGGVRGTWSMSYPGLTQVHSANSGEWMIVLTNSSAQSPQTAGAGRVCVWSRDGKKLREEPLAVRATSAAISPDSGRLAVGLSSGQGVLVWNTKTWQRESPIVVTDGVDVDAVTFSNDGQWLAFTTSSASLPGAWELWDLAARKQTRRATPVKPGRVRAIGIAHQDELLVMTGHDDGNVWLWKGESVDETPRALRAGLAVTALAIAPHDHLIAVGAGKYFSLWNYQQGKREFAAPSREGDISCVAYSPSEREICWGAGRSVQCFDTAARRASARLDDLPGNVLSLAYTPDATRMFVALANGQLMLCWMNQRSGKFE